MVRQIEYLLRDLGWADGFHIPVANDENKVLEQKVEQKIKEKGELTIQSEDLIDRVNSLYKHTENVKVEQQQNQAILTAHKRQVETEENLYQAALAEQDSYERELRCINKAFHELGDRHIALQNGIFKHTEKLEKLKSNVKWNKDTLLSWEEDLTRGDEDNQLLAKYAVDDESKAKELELARLRLSKEVEERNQLLSQIINEVETLERVLDRTAKLFRKAHSERQDFIKQWESSVQVLHQRDNDIHSRVQEIAMLRSEARKKVEMLREQQQFLRNEMNNNKEIELQISTMTRSNARLRDDYNALVKTVDELTSELAAMRRTLAGTAARLEHQRSRNTGMANGVIVKQHRIQELTEAVEATKDRLNQIKDRTSSAAERANHLDAMIQCEEKTIAILTQDTGKLNELMFHAKQELFDLQRQEELQQVGIRKLESSKVLIASHIKATEKELISQKELIYNKEFEAQMIEARIARLLGTTVNIEEKEAYDKKIQELEEILSEKTATFNLLTSENQHLEEKMRWFTKTYTEDSAELERLIDKKENRVLLTEGGKKQLKNCKAHNQERQVEENVLHLRVAQAEKTIACEGNKVYSLEKQKLELEAAMKERQVEIGANKDVLNVQKRSLCEEKSRLISAIKGCEYKTNLMQKKYDIVMDSLGKGEDNEEVSVTYFKIKAAQEKYQLQKEGDELDAKIRQTEKEILAMENTLRVINATNETYKKSLAEVDENSEEFMQKKELESQYFATVDLLRHRKSELGDLKDQTEILDQTLLEIISTEDALRASWQNKDQEVNDLTKELQEQAGKLQRSERQLRRSVREMKAMSQTKLMQLEERDVELRELQEQNLSALQQLAEFVARYMEAGPVVTRYLEEKGLSLPVSRSPGGSLTHVSRECLKHAPPVKSPSVAYPGQVFPEMKQLSVPETSSSHLSVTTSQDYSSSGPSSRSSRTSRSSQKSGGSVKSASVKAASVVTLDSTQLPGGSEKLKGVTTSAPSLKSKSKLG